MGLARARCAQACRAQFRVLRPAQSLPVEGVDPWRAAKACHPKGRRGESTLPPALEAEFREQTEETGYGVEHVRIEDLLPAHPLSAPFHPIGVKLRELGCGDERRARA